MTKNDNIRAQVAIMLFGYVICLSGCILGNFYVAKAGIFILTATFVISRISNAL